MSVNAIRCEMKNQKDHFFAFFGSFGLRKFHEKIANHFREFVRQ